MLVENIFANRSMVWFGLGYDVMRWDKGKSSTAIPGSLAVILANLRSWCPILGSLCLLDWHAQGARNQADQST